jgi:hypothetical protein
MAFKMKSGKEGPMYKNFGVGAPTKKYGNSSNKMAHESPNKQTDQELMAADKAKMNKRARSQDGKGKTDKERSLGDKIKNVVSPNKSTDKAKVDKSSDRFKNAMANTKKKKERDAKKADLTEKTSNSQRYTDKENLANDKELSSLKQKKNKPSKIQKLKGDMMKYNAMEKQMKKFIADHTEGAVGDSTTLQTSNKQVTKILKNMAKDLGKQGKKVSKGPELGPENFKKAQKFLQQEAGRKDKQGKIVKMNSPAKQKASKVMAKNEKHNAKVKAYNDKLKEMKAFIADNTTGAVGDSTRFKPANVESMKKYESIEKELKKLGKKVK